MNITRRVQLGLQIGAVMAALASASGQEYVRKIDHTENTNSAGTVGSRDYFEHHFANRYMVIDNQLIDIGQRPTINGGKIHGTVIQVFDATNICCAALQIGATKKQSNLGHIIVDIGNTDGVAIGDTLDLDIVHIGQVQCLMENGETNYFPKYSIPKFISFEDYERFRSPDTKIKAILSQ